MNKESAIKILDMFLDKQCSLGRVEFAYDADEVWYAVNLARDELQKTKTYEDGLADAWDAARKIPNMNPQVCINVFEGNGCLEHVLQNISPQEAIAKIKEWEDSKKIKKGDEVRISSETGIVVFVDGSVCDVLFDYGCYEDLEIERISKTGRNFADKLDALLGEIGNG